MRHFLTLTAVALGTALASQPAHACIIWAEFNVQDIAYADVVVVGSITNYKVVGGDGSQPDDLLSDYAIFDVNVDEVLSGKAPAIIRVTWDNSTFGEPDKMDAGPYLIALRDPSSAIPPLRGPSATILPSREPETLTILQAPCASPFILPKDSDEAQAARQVLSSRE